MDEAPVVQWNRIGTYDTEGTCEARRNEAVKARREETMRMTKSSPLPSIDMWRAAERDRRRAEASDCISAETTHASRRNRRGEGHMTRQSRLDEGARPVIPPSRWRGRMKVIE